MFDCVSVSGAGFDLKLFQMHLILVEYRHFEQITAGHHQAQDTKISANFLSAPRFMSLTNFVFKDHSSLK